MLGLCEQCYGDSLNIRHKSIIDRCVRFRVAGIPEAQLRFVNNSPSGTGIIKHGSVCIPFDNRMGKEENPMECVRLYRVRKR